MKIHVAPYEHRFPLSRQLPQATQGKWRNCCFYEKRYFRDADWLVVYDNPEGKIFTHLPLERRILITAEPPEILPTYPRQYLAQFGVIVTFRNDISAPRLIKSHCALPWFVGLRRRPGVLFDLKSEGSIYDKVASTDFTATKNQFCSVVVSDKKYVYGHERRLEFVHRLKLALGEKLHVYGDGIHPICDKLDAIAPYKYHIVLENSQNRDYWTEKLADCYLGEAFPIYWGCPNIHDYFSPEAIKVLDLHDLESAVVETVQFLKKDPFLERVSAVKKAKSLVLEKYNLISLICDVVNSLSDTPKKRLLWPQVIKPWRILRQKDTLFRFGMSKLKKFLKKNESGAFHYRV